MQDSKSCGCSVRRSDTYHLLFQAQRIRSLLCLSFISSAIVCDLSRVLTVNISQVVRSVRAQNHIIIRGAWSKRDSSLRYLPPTGHSSSATHLVGIHRQHLRIVHTYHTCRVDRKKSLRSLLELRAQSSSCAPLPSVNPLASHIIAFIIIVFHTR